MSGQSSSSSTTSTTTSKTKIYVIIIFVAIVVVITAAVAVYIMVKKKKSTTTTTTTPKTQVTNPQKVQLTNTTDEEVKYSTASTSGVIKPYAKQSVTMGHYDFVKTPKGTIKHNGKLSPKEYFITMDGPVAEVAGTISVSNNSSRKISVSYVLPSSRTGEHHEFNPGDKHDFKNVPIGSVLQMGTIMDPPNVKSVHMGVMIVVPTDYKVIFDGTSFKFY